MLNTRNVFIKDGHDLGGQQTKFFIFISQSVSCERGSGQLNAS